MAEDNDSERTIGELTIRIDHTLCVGFGHCVEEAYGAFELDDDDVVQFAEPQKVSREDLIAACEVCPVEALLAFDADGKQLAP